jgi:spermidine/putrescine transport system permease protein
MVMIPFWTNFLVRTYAMQFMLRANGPINAGLLAMFGEDGWLTPLLGGANSPLFMEGPAELLFTPGAIMIGLVYGNLPFMILPLYSSMEKFDWSLLEAANDLGANWWRSFIRVLLPITLPGLIAGSILVFVPALGNYVTVDLMGGGTSNMIGRAIAQQFGSSNNWPFGSALSLLLMVIVSIAAVVYFRVGRGEQK